MKLLAILLFAGLALMPFVGQKVRWGCTGR